MSYAGELFAQIVESGFVPKTVLSETRQIGSMAASYQSIQNSGVLLFWSLSSTSNRGSSWSGRKRGSQRIKCTVPSGILTWR
jgi:hypothetical protein